jgi:hypothetical protein
LHDVKSTNRSNHDAAEIYRDGCYLERNPSWHLEDSLWKAKQIQKILLRNKLSPASFCEIGCGAGEVLRQLSQEYGEAEFNGFELSPQAFELCKQREGQRLKFFNEDLLKRDDYYECALCIDVFEHVEDYLGFLRELRKKANYKIFHIPIDIYAVAAVRESMIKSRQVWGHLHYFSKETAVATLKDCGYDIIDGFYTASFEELPSKTWKSRMIRLPRKILFRLSPRWSVRLLGGCSYLVLAR